MRSATRVLVLAVIVATVSVFAGSAQANTSSQNARLVYTTFTKYYGSSVGTEMVRCMYRESHGNERAANYGDSNGGSYGLLQLNGAHRWRSETIQQFRYRMWNVKEHLAQAVRLFRDAKHYYGNGFQPWGGGC